ncbi:unnamed protein product [Candidula unifasciata]|uniref:Transmembrane protein n=1 Tax=Candidula unifasciata TaxID=100452 RepID=A0A8S3YVX8_9EUPU|nr:unnamed protein product [Candidula unifasciata]
MTSQNELVIPTVSVADSSIGGAGDGRGGGGCGEEDEDAEEVTETKIIGVTETGVIRKRSFKRKLTKEEMSKRTYGADKAEYAKIAERVLNEKMFSGAVEGLRERWKMLTYMHTDCMDMVDQWMARREELLQKRRRKDVDIIVALVVASFVFIIVCWCIKTFIWW